VLIFDQLKKSDPHLRWLAVVLAGGLVVLLVGLWWVQIVSARDFQSRLETQSYRSVRVLPVRGHILDRNGVVLGDNRPSLDACLYLEEMRPAFNTVFDRRVSDLRQHLAAARTEAERRLGRELTKTEAKSFRLSVAARAELGRQARYEVASNSVAGLGAILGRPLTLDRTAFEKHYTDRLVLPLPVAESLDATNLARFEEHPDSPRGLDLDVQPLRWYPFGTTAAHVIGQIRRDETSAEGEDSFLNYPLPVSRGTVGIEGVFDRELRGRSGSKSVLVNNLGYRQSEYTWTPALPGQNVVLTLDLRIQRAAEQALAASGKDARGAVVVLDVRNGDILALASAPTFDPNLFVRPMPRAEWDRLNDEDLTPQKNRALQKNYAPGSIFKIIVSLALLEQGVRPEAKITVPEDSARPGRGCIFVGRRKIEDLAPPGEYNFHRAFLKSSNTYFVTNGIQIGAPAIIRMAQRFHLGEKTGVPTWQDVPGTLPDFARISRNLTDGETANLCIGQGLLDVTPLQMAVMTAAVANGGTVFWPRLVSRVEAQEPGSAGSGETFPAGRVREQLRIAPAHLRLLREAMLADTEDVEGTGYAAFHRGKPGPPLLENFRVGGKTGTAQVTDEQNRVVDRNAWFASFAPADHPRYAIVAVVEGGGSGGGAAAPVCREVYRVIEQLERRQGVLAQR
jgi:penicillin-binding protein 2